MLFTHYCVERIIKRYLLANTLPNGVNSIRVYGDAIEVDLDYTSLEGLDNAKELFVKLFKDNYLPDKGVILIDFLEKEIPVEETENVCYGTPTIFSHSPPLHKSKLRAFYTTSAPSFSGRALQEMAEDLAYKEHKRVLILDLNTTCSYFSMAASYRDKVSTVTLNELFPDNLGKLANVIKKDGNLYTIPLYSSTTDMLETKSLLYTRLEKFNNIINSLVELLELDFVLVDLPSGIGELQLQMLNNLYAEIMFVDTEQSIYTTTRLLKELYGFIPKYSEIVLPEIVEIVKVQPMEVKSMYNFKLEDTLLSLVANVYTRM